MVLTSLLTFYHTSSKYDGFLNKMISRHAESSLQYSTVDLQILSDISIRARSGTPWRQAYHLPTLSATNFHWRAKIVAMAAIGSLVFCTDCGNLLEGSSGNKDVFLICDVCGTKNRGVYCLRQSLGPSNEATQCSCGQPIMIRYRCNFDHYHL